MKENLSEVVNEVVYILDNYDARSIAQMLDLWHSHADCDCTRQRQHVLVAAGMGQGLPASSTRLSTAMNLSEHRDC